MAPNFTKSPFNPHIELMPERASTLGPRLKSLTINRLIMNQQSWPNRTRIGLISVSPMDLDERFESELIMPRYPSSLNHPRLQSSVSHDFFQVSAVLPRLSDKALDGFRRRGKLSIDACRRLQTMSRAPRTLLPCQNRYLISRYFRIRFRQRSRSVRIESSDMRSMEFRACLIPRPSEPNASDNFRTLIVNRTARSVEI